MHPNDVLTFQGANLFGRLCFYWFLWFLDLIKSIQGISHYCNQLLNSPRALVFWAVNQVLQHILLVFRVTRHCTLIHMKFSSVIRHIPLDSINPSLAIGFYCRVKDDFDDFCSRASKLAEESNGALLITIAQSWRFLLQTASNNSPGGNLGFQDDDSVAMDVANEAGNNEDDWQLL
ncbi:hypothetical protein S83_036074 [Arachis hypogaea]